LLPVRCGDNFNHVQISSAVAEEQTRLISLRALPLKR
jgi:hypothetical protein